MYMKYICKLSLILTGLHFFYLLIHKNLNQMDKYLLHNHCHYLLSEDSGHLVHIQLQYHLCIVRNHIKTNNIYNNIVRLH